MAVYTTIDNPELYFQCQLYTGNGSDNRAVTLDGDENMQPDFLWIKNREATFAHALFDSVRGSSKMLVSSSSDAEQTNPSSGGLTSFDSDGFTTDAGSGSNPYRNTNESGDGYVAWCWKAGTTSGINATGANTTPTTYSFNQTAGFSIIQYDGNGTDDTQIAHGLAAVPGLMLIKNMDADDDGGVSWAVYHHRNTDAPETDFLTLDEQDAGSDASNRWSDEAPTSVLFTTGDNSTVNKSSRDYLGYLWSEKQGYSKFGTYTGNSNANGTFIYTGFSPAYVLVKRTDTGNKHWRLWDDKRSTYNSRILNLYPNDTDGEGAGHSSYGLDFLSNGFKLRGSDADLNTGTLVYIAFARAPLVNSEGEACNAV